MTPFRYALRRTLKAPMALALALLAASCGATSDVPTVQPPPEAVAALEAVRPSGLFAVGLKDLSGVSTTPLWLFYPAEGVGESGAMPSPASYNTALTRRFGAPAAAALMAARSSAGWNAKPAEEPFPVLVFAPGAGMGARDYRLLLEDLVSHGYVVAAVNPLGSPPVSDRRYGEAADEMVRAAAIVRGLAAKEGFIDGARVGFVGHSLGGAAAVLALSKDARACVAINLDGDYSAAANAPAPAKPILYVVGLTDGERQASRDRRSRTWKTVSNGNDRAIALQIQAARHFDFADAALLPPATISDDRRRNRFGPIGGARAHAVIAKLLVGFLDEALAERSEHLAAVLVEAPEARRVSAF